MSLPNLNKYNLKDLVQYKLALTQAYNHYNRKYFRNRLPLVEFTNVGKWSHSNGYVRMFGYNSLMLGINPALRGDAFYNTLLHEMCHIAQITFDGVVSKSALEEHGRAWRSWMLRVGLDPDEHEFVRLKQNVPKESVEYLQDYEADDFKLDALKRHICYVRFIYNTTDKRADDLVKGNASFSDVTNNTHLVEGICVPFTDKEIVAPHLWTQAVLFITPQLECILTTYEKSLYTLCPTVLNRKAKATKLRDKALDNIDKVLRNTINLSVGRLTSYELWYSLVNDDYLGYLDTEDPMIHIIKG